MATKTSRNAPCPCGSGRKFKTCCLAVGRLSPVGATTEHFHSPALNRPLHRGLPRPISPTPRLSTDAAGGRKEWKELHLDVPLHDGTALHIVLLHTEQWLRTNGFSAGYGMTVNLPQISYKGMALLTAVRPAEWAAASEGEIKAVFQRFTDADSGILVLGARRSRSVVSFGERCADLRLLSLELIERRGHLARRVNIELLRSVEWVRERKIGIGASVFLDEPSEGLHGRATVRGIQPCPPRERWRDKMRAGEYEPWPCRVGDLKVVSESKPIGVTPGHPIWSADRNDFVSAGRLEPGERVLTESGPSTVEWYVMREVPEEAVYNLEVDADHVFRVGETGVLVHNNSAPATDPYCRSECNVTFQTGLLTAPNPNNLVSKHIASTDQLSNDDGVYVKRHFMKTKAGKAFNFRKRYSLSDPEGGCPIWYELKRTRDKAPDGLCDADSKYWSASRQRRFDEAFLDALIPAAQRFAAPRETAALDPLRWKTQRHIFGYGTLPDNFVRDSDD